MFAAVAAGNPLQLSEEVANSNGLQHTIILSSTKPKSYSHISIFILPNVTFPENFIATVYFKLVPTDDFKLFGYLSLEKPSAIFKVKLPGGGNTNNGTNNFMSPSNDGLGEIDMDDDYGSNEMNPMMDGNGPQTNNNLSQVTIGISIEPREEGLLKIQEWKQEMSIQNSKNASSLVLSRPNGAMGIPLAVRTAGELAKTYPALTKELAAKIVQHAYNYLSGFLDNNGNVSIKRFDTWWDKFKNRLENDGAFLDEVTNA
ncbi:similar to Saccharomyces cerevisiae YOL032W OPI10 Protein with a possible role in phospholipid biosynthesis [Maudiozyma saulgeensis]|uniref:Similar to Saccharomyces cerevisiae YOL032W OPI10 Protein with a possible role in phospholipid biosynthesis n=1 Tax=Maudiozyma saulgeensis TaxID=1789683 RepID=A0A1X7R377_9SACH|nr:similar to Saccharomyces cerevisiae YOL032W OPI10 Protein with a possible role in phospholipid biosynthesis [Kazachstania saulgeensis]